MLGITTPCLLSFVLGVIAGFHVYMMCCDKKNKSEEMR